MNSNAYPSDSSAVINNDIESEVDDAPVDQQYHSKLHSEMNKYSDEESGDDLSELVDERPTLHDVWKGAENGGLVDKPLAITFDIHEFTSDNLVGYSRSPTEEVEDDDGNVSPQYVGLLQASPLHDSNSTHVGSNLFAGNYLMHYIYIEQNHNN
jgi:hypothetical protein